MVAPLALKRCAYVIFIRTDIDDQSAIELYSKPGVRKDVLYFDIAVESDNGAA